MPGSHEVGIAAAGATVLASGVWDETSVRAHGCLREGVFDRSRLRVVQSRPIVPTSHVFALPKRSLTVLAAAVAVLGGAVALGTRIDSARGAAPGNVIFILTDDMTTSELSALPAVRSLVGAQGVRFKRAYVSYPNCCPSRATLFSGQYMHNHDVRGNSQPFGGWKRFQPHEPESLGPWLQGQGYYTGHIGKYLNGYLANGVNYVPPGWDEWYAKVGQGANRYLNYSLIEDRPGGPGPQQIFYSNQDDNQPDTDYQTDVYKYKALDFIDRVGGPIAQPFYLSISFGAPHGPYQPAARHLHSRSGAKLPKLPGFNEKDISDKPQWLRVQAEKRLTKGLIKGISNDRRRRLEQLASVNDAITAIFDKLADQGLLDSTYVIFSSDNGFFQGQHRIVSGKYLAYEPASRVPLLIRGPGIAADRTSSELVSNVDIPLTTLDIAGAPKALTGGLDGRSLIPYATNPARKSSSRPLLFEADTGKDLAAGAVTATSRAAGVAGRAGVSDLDQESDSRSWSRVARGTTAPAYRGLRTNRYAYFVYANGQSELYDMVRDPAQLRSLAKDRRYRRVRRWLLKRLSQMAGCDGAECRVAIGKPPKPLS